MVLTLTRLTVDFGSNLEELSYWLRIYLYLVLDGSWGLISARSEKELLCSSSFSIQVSLLTMKHMILYILCMIG